MGGPFLVLSRTPLVQIASITIDGTTIDADEYEISDAEAGLVYRAACWPWSGLRLGGIAQDRLSGTERRNIVVTYAGGYVTPGQATAQLPRTLPFDLEQHCVDTVVYLYRTRGQDLSVVGERLLSAAYQYERGHGLPASVAKGLASYIRIASA
jgi:hypothetical protein